MLELILIGLPVLFASMIYFMNNRPKQVRILLLTLGVLHFLLFLLLAAGYSRPVLPEWIQSDSLSVIFAGVTSFLFLCVSVHAFFWLPETRIYEKHEGRAMRENLFCSLLCLFLSTMTLVVFSRNYGLLWVAVEATTLASAPLIMFHRSAGSLEAMWKYLLICSVGIGLALFGTFLLGVAVRSAGLCSDLSFTRLPDTGSDGVFHTEWFKAAFLFCFAGYGLKMGLAPFHTWLPDAHSEAPSMVSVLLSGSLLNCSFLGIVRVAAAAPSALIPFCSEYLIGFGVFSLLVAAFFLIRQSDYKRMLAYSSVEHMGLLAIFCGLEMTELSDAAQQHLMMHSVCKMILFLTAGNLLLAHGTRRIDLVRGTFSRMPVTSTVWLAGILLICGVPPSPLFVTEMALVLNAGPVLGSVILVLLFAIFCGMTSTAMKMTMGPGVSGELHPAERAAERLSVLPAVLIVIPVVAGLRLICQITGVIR